jgi:hypothetical protein
MPITENGTTTSFGVNGVSTSGPQTLGVGGTSQSDAMMIANICFTTTSTTPETVASVIDSQGNTWHKLLANTDNAGWFTGDTVNGVQRSFTQEIWYTTAATINASIDVTVAFSGTIDACSATFSTKLLGYDHTDPFDLNASLPKILKGVHNIAESIGGISTDTTHIYPVWCLGLWGTSIGVSNAVFDGQSRNQQETLQKNASEFVKSQYAGGIISGGPGVTGPYASVTFASPTSASNYFLTGIVVTADVQTIPVVDPLDGTRILEWGTNAIGARRYQEADYDSIWSRGDRVANGLFTVGDYGFTGMFAPMSEGFDNKYGTGIGNGPTPAGDTSAPFYPAMSTAVWWDTSPWPLELHGIKWLGTETIAADGTSWRIVGGFELGSVLTDSYALEFGNFIIWQDTTDAELGSPMLSRTLDFTPISPISWPHYELIRPLDESFPGNRIANELLLKVTHSILDGGDRRSTNGRVDKRVGFTMSSNWTFTTGSGLIDPENGLFDGKYNRSASGESTKGGEPCVLIKSVTGSGQHPQTTVGEWLQFEFPRKVRFHHLVFNLANGDLEALDSGGNPTFYGKWHWEVSDGGGFTQVGGSWYFSESSEFMVAPGATAAAGFGLPDDGGHLKWRMVLEAGPAFGNDKLLAQVIFHLDDPGNQDPGLSVAFTDDIDEEPPLLQPAVAGSPYIILFTDGSDDALAAPLSVTFNAILTIEFTDGTSDQLTMFSDLFPSVVVQTFTHATGR